MSTPNAAGGDGLPSSCDDIERATEVAAVVIARLAEDAQIPARIWATGRPGDDVVKLGGSHGELSAAGKAAAAVALEYEPADYWQYAFTLAQAN